MLAMSQSTVASLPDRWIQLMRSFMPSRCILTALELDLFTAIGNGSTAEQAASTAKTDARATGMLLNALVAIGLLTKEGEVFHNSPDSAQFFVGGTRGDCREGWLHIADIWHTWTNLTESIRLGTRIPLERSSSPEWTRNFIAGMQYNASQRALILVEAVGTKGVRRVLDLGGGSGIYSIAFAKASPDIHCEIRDLPKVVPLTAKYVKQAGYEARIAIREGNMLKDDLGSGLDLVLLNAICHMFSPEDNQQLFRRIRRALAPEGRLVVQDFILSPDKSGPLHAALFSLNMLVATDGGASYSESEYASWMSSAGFAGVQRTDLPGPGSLIIGRAR
jgi:predicted O-methyltransferase YrrM